MKFKRGPSIGLLLLLAALATAAQAEVSESTDLRTLDRFHDPVVIRTSLLEGLGNSRTNGLRLYGAHAGSLEPIPYQFDERDEDDEIVFGSNNVDLGFAFDSNDELVFMAKDSGDRVDWMALPANADKALEIEITDPVTGEEGWVYLIRFDEPAPPRSSVVYAIFDRDRNEARALFYTMEYFPGHNFFTGMRIAAVAGGSGTNILDRMKIRMNPTFSLFGMRWSPVFTEEDFSAVIDGVKNGPVRAIRRVQHRMNLGKFFPVSPGGTVYTYFYFSSFATPTTFSFPWIVLKSMRDFRFTGVSDFRRSAIGMRYWDGANTESFQFGGQNQDSVETQKDHDWWVLSGKGGTCLHAFLLPDALTDLGIVRGTLFIDDDLANDPEGPESEPGTHAVGYELLNVANLSRAGTYNANLATVILDRPYQPGDEVQPLDMYKAPLRASVKTLTSKPGA